MLRLELVLPLAEENGAPTPIAGGRALRRQHKILDVGHRVAHEPTELQELRAAAPVAPALLDESLMGPKGL